MKRTFVLTVERIDIRTISINNWPCPKCRYERALLRTSGRLEGFSVLEFTDYRRDEFR